MILINKKVKYAFNILFIAVVGILTFRLLFANQETSKIIEDLHLATKGWLALGFVAVFCFIAGESVIIKYMLRLFNEKIPFMRCLKYSFIGFFYSYITPSSSGGQPAQMIYMKKDGVNYGYSSLIMLVIAAVYKAVLVLLGVIFYIVYHSFVIEHVGKMLWLLYVGFFLNIAYIFLLIFVCLKPVWARKMGIKLINFLTAVRILKKKNNERYVAKITRVFDNYTKGADYMKKNLHSIFNITIITALQRLSLLALTWIVYRAYGLSGVSCMKMIALQTMIGVAVEMLPLPGAAGITEGCFLVFFSGIFTDELIRPAILLTRGLNFYAVIIVGAIVTFTAHFINMKKSKKSEVETKGKGEEQ